MSASLDINYNSTAVRGLPDGGTLGQVLIRTEIGHEWGIQSSLNKVVNSDNLDYTEFRKPDQSMFIVDLRTGLLNNGGLWADRESLVYE